MANSKDSDPVGYRGDANHAYGLPWAFKRLPLFFVTAPVFRSVKDEIAIPYAPVALDPDHSLDDLVNRFEWCEPALGDDAMRRTVGFFQHRIWFCVSCYLFPQ